MQLCNPFTDLTVQLNGAAIVNAKMTLPNGKKVQPFFQAPWRDDPPDQLAALPAILRHLAGEWPCVPFGTVSERLDLPPNWAATGKIPDWNEHAHGYGSNHDWTLTKTDPTCLDAEIAYPATTPIRKLLRTIELNPHRAQIDFSLTIQARKDTRLPVGLHPVLNLHDCSAQSCRLRVGGTGTAWTLPIDLEPGRSQFAPDQQGPQIDAIGTTSGGVIDATRLPFADDSEDLLMLSDPGGRVTLEMPDKGYSVSVVWNAVDLPSCVLWFSNGGRRQYPWNARVRAIGIEPVAAPFDLGTLYAQTTHSPLQRANVRRTIHVKADTPWTTNYSISVSPV